MTEWQKKKVREIAAHYGIKSQEQVAIEECAELIQAITKSNREITASKPGEQCAKEYVKKIGDVAGEIADVRIMCEQLTYLYGIGELVKEQIDFKIARQLGRMEKGE